ncbi:MAG: chromosomal replication initiator protein DnaA [Bacteroidaceae bacterium]|nr:chromosomal replication initiator protein DnaA [Bacteroidaceae bacterium]
MTQNEYKEKWERCLEIIKNNFGESNQSHYKTWFEPLSFYSYNAQSKELKINAPSSFYGEYIGAHFAKLTYSALRREFGTDVRLLLRQLTDSENKIRQTEEVPKSTLATIRPATHKANEAPTPLQSHAVSPEIDSHLIADYTFDNFIEGVSNLLPRSVGMSIAKNPDQTTFNPLFIYGHSGVGKTHLVNAIGKAIKDLHPQKKVIYLSAHLFQVQYVDSVRKNTFNDFIRYYQQFDVLILDDVQEFAAQEKTQETFFHIFNHLKQNGKQIILTCDRPPVELKGMQERLLTRFKWGLLAELEQPDEKLRRGILNNKIHRNGLKIPQDVVEYISKNVTNSVRDLEGVINSLMAHSVVYNCDINLDMARRIIKVSTNVEKKPITIDEIIEHACVVCKVKKEEIFSATRRAPVVMARQIAMYLAQKHTDLSTSKIGALVGKRNHTTVLHSVRSVTEQMDTNKALGQMIKQIENNIIDSRKN